MRASIRWSVLALSFALAACGSNSSNGGHATPTQARTETALATTTPTAAPSRTPTAADTASPSPSRTATAVATATPAPDGAACERAAAAGLAACVEQCSSALRQCFETDGHTCAADDAASATALGALAGTVAAACPDAATVRAVGYGDQFTPDGLTARLQDACRSEAAALAVRSFGGPHGAALGAADAAGRTCLGAAHQAGVTLLASALTTYNTCLDQAACDAAAAADHVEAARAAASASIGAQCAALQNLVAVDVPTFIDRTAAQARCLAAVAHPDTAPLTLDCGPRDALPETPRGQYVQIILDEATYGTRCGDGSPYAFWVRLAPAGSPVDHVVVGLQGGGVCVFGDDCATRPADLFEALNDQPETTGPLSNDPAISPFADWTKVYLPYCTQDVFIGGGATSNFEQVTVQRFGSIDVRAALRVVRDVVWRELDRERDGGYRTDAVRALFGGFSAGAFGTIYNYHWVLDDLQWAHTAAYPDAGLALDNGQPIGVATLGALVVSDVAPLGWGARNYLPPYCFATNCGVGPVLLEKTAPRLKAVPEQQLLILSNQVDQTQVETTYFDTVSTWVNALRTSYCATRELNGVQYYLPAITESTHVISPRNELYTNYPVDGVLMRDWLESGFSAPDSITDHVEEGTLVTDIPGVQPFPCD